METITPIYEIYALKYAGPFTSKMAFVLWSRGWNEEIDRYYYIWANKSMDSWIIIDTRTGVTFGTQRGLTGYVKPVDVLAGIGVNGNNVTMVVLTHIHFDHAGGMEMFPEAFPKAIFCVQKKEFDFWVTNPVARRKPFQSITDAEANKTIAAMKWTERLVFVEGDKKILPGLELLLAPGHTVGLSASAA